MPSPPVLLTSVEMGYGHLRAAHALASALTTDVLNVDEAPLADAAEHELWLRTRRLYELISRASQLPVVGRPFHLALDLLTKIPHLYPSRDLSAPNGAVRYLQRNVRRGLGAGLIQRLRRTGETLLTTFYAPAVAADYAGCERLFCVVTDTDLHRVWVPADSRRTRIRYLVPSHRAQRRLRAYGVAPENIIFTGFPLPPELLGGRDLPVLKRNLAARLRRLDPRGVFRDDYADEIRHFLGIEAEAGHAQAPLVTFAVGGAGAQAGLARRFLPAFRPHVEAGRLRLALVAGIRRPIADLFTTWLGDVGLSQQLGRGVQILCEPDVPSYLARFNALIAETDVLWTKPSELTFFGALGLPLVMAPPMGSHEGYNLRWAREAGAGLKQREPASMPERLLDWLDDGTLAAAAWSGFMRMPKFGTYRIVDAVTG